MATSSKGRRSRVGYGSTYRRRHPRDLGQDQGIDTILGGQVWKIKPDRKAKAQYPCLWMQAGVVAFKSCNNYYDCITCKYDAGMLRQVQQGKKISWQNAMRRKPDRARICRHSMTNRIESRICAHDYHCAKCDFDQLFEDVWSPMTDSYPVQIQAVRGYQVPDDYYFHQGHTWARVESGGYIRIGLDDFALKVLGRPDRLELPLMGQTLTQGKPGWSLARRGHQAGVLSPVDGVVMDVNPRARENPAQTGHEPYGQGWLMTVRSRNVRQTVKGLMDHIESLNWMNAETQALEDLIEDVAGPLAADGGHLQPDLFDNIPELGWRRLTQTVLKTD